MRATSVGASMWGRDARKRQRGANELFRPRSGRDFFAPISYPILEIEAGWRSSFLAEFRNRLAGPGTPISNTR